ncbi:hypothetical protein ESCO_002875 [Escovopsis weberi]|uniref:Cyclin N-terminal domain-containing protein n=1 Tax=Escovopsis weberi TaxID=150374 RepID=A0A0M9VSU8_ESCWE|nr:hypothetical protein ESCO_002875 [Escovopsis weberi]
MRRPDGCGNKHNMKHHFDDDGDVGYFTYRPLSRLPTPPPTWNHRDASAECLGDDEPASPKYRGPAIHLVNLIPSSASFADASVPFVQALLTRAHLPIETIALAVCLLDSLDAKFARKWRLTCPLENPSSAAASLQAPSASSASSPSSPIVTPVHPGLHKRHTLPLPPRSLRPLHIDSVRPEIIVLAALVIAAKFTQDLQEDPTFYRLIWGKNLWSRQQFNVTERCIMESLDYRILPLCGEDCLADAMVDMQLAGRWDEPAKWDANQLTPPDSAEGSECEFAPF